MSDYIKRVKKLNLPTNEYVVIGSGLLDVLGIRKAVDIDIVASRQLFKKLQKEKHKKKWFLEDS